MMMHERKSILQILFRGGLVNALMEFSVVQVFLVGVPYLALSLLSGRFLWFFWPVEYVFTTGVADLTGGEIFGGMIAVGTWAILTAVGLMLLWGSIPDDD